MGKHKLLALLLALTLVRGLIYAAIVPPWQAPDESYHFLSAQLPGLADDPAAGATWEGIKSKTVSSLVEFHYWDMNINQPAVRGPEEVSRYLPGGFNFTEQTKPRSFVYYLFSAWLKLVPRQGITFQLYWIRLLSVLLNVAIVAIAYATARLLFGDDPFGRVLLPLSIVFLPLHTYVLSVVNDGNLAELFASLAIFFWIWGLTRGWHWSKVVGLGSFTILAIGAKPNAFYLALAIPVWAILYYRRRILNVANLIYFLIATILIVGATSSSHLRNYLTVAWRTAQIALQGQRLEDSEVLGRGAFETFRAFWAQMSWTSLLLSDVWGNWLLVLSLLAGLGLLKFVLTTRKHTRGESQDNGIVIALVLCVLASASQVPVYILITKFTLSQSRYLFSAIIPIMALLVIGWRELIPSNWRAEGLALIVSFFFLFDAVVLLNYGLPFFYPLWR